MKEGLWGIVNETEAAPNAETQADLYAKFIARRDRALAVIVLSIEPSLLYLIGEPKNPITVWKKLGDHFQKKTWANKLELRRKLHSLRLKEGESVQEHIKSLTEVFEALSVVGDPVSEEDRVVQLLASLPDSFNMLVTALEANAVVPDMDVVTERILHEERKMKNREDSGNGEVQTKAMAAYRPRNRASIKCFYCGKFGHIQRYCRIRAEDESKAKSEKSDTKQKANKAARKLKNEDSSSCSEGDALVASHALSANVASNWIVDSGATCHMCSDPKVFTKLRSLEPPQKVTLGDGHELKAIGQGIVKLTISLSNGKTKECKLNDVLFVPNLSYNLLSVSKAAETGKITEFDETQCQILGTNKRIIAVAKRTGSLYYLDTKPSETHLVTAAETKCQDLKQKASIWHRRFGHLGMQNLQKLTRNEMVDNFDYSPSNAPEFCEACVGGKHHRSPFQTCTGIQSKEPLDLVHSDVCGKLNTKSLGGAEYFLTFVDDKTRYVWVYPLKYKDEVFDGFLEWKALIEKSSGLKLKAIRTDNGGEYTSKKFESYLKSEGIRHERTVPKTPEQNGVAERLNRTLVEMVRSMLIDANLSHKFWAEALSTAAYLKNRSPSRGLEGITPVEALTKRKPKVDHLRIFGCDAYVHIPKDERNKLDSKAKKTIFMGYGNETKGYRLYDPQRGKIFYSRDVKFNETKREFEQASSDIEQETNHQVILDFESNDDGEIGSDHQEAPPTTPEEPTLRRSSREKRPPEYYGIRVNIVDEKPKEPLTVDDAFASADREKWQDAMEKEMKSLNDNEVWELVELPEGRKAVGSKWVYKVKTDANGSIERYKARLVAQGFSQKYGTDYDETFCPVVRLESFRTIVALAVQYGLKVHQIDVTTAFLNGELKEVVYMRQPQGFIAKGQEHLVCKLKKSIYGLKQSPRCWNTALHNQLTMMEFVQADSDPCVYRASGGEVFFMGVYVDDIILAGESEKRMKEVKDTLTNKFDIKDMGELHYFLGMKIQLDKTGDIWIGQPAYAESLLQKFGMSEAKPVSTPVDTSIKFIQATEDEKCIDQQVYQSAIGSLLYLSVATRPDITFAVSNMARFSSKPTTQHWTGVKRIMRYLQGTINHGILYTKLSSRECIGFSDADWAGDLDNRRSTSGYLFQISGGPVSWRSKKQSSVALSTAEAEYVALASSAQEAVWMRQLTTELGSAPTDATTIFEDNQSAISMASNPQFHGRAKHISIKYHFIREKVSDGMVKLRYCPTTEMIADMLTKGLSKEQLAKLRHIAGIVTMPEHFVCK